MSLSKERILYLLDKYSGDRTTREEENELFAWVNKGDDNELFHQHIKKLIDQYNSEEAISRVDWDGLFKKIHNEGFPEKRHSLVYEIAWFRWTAAVLVIFFLGAGAYLYLDHSSPKKMVAVKIKATPVIKDITPPAESKAVLTLADGRKIALDSIGNGTLAQQGNVKVIKQADGQITYNGTGNEILYNTLNVPRGSKIVTLKLSDGTQVWLNSESSLRYPASFTGIERKVEITGEAYFEVAHSASVPFIVKDNAIEIKVLGTHFNFNTYQDEGTNKVTLLEGSIAVSMGSYKNVIKPGQQAQISKDIKVINAVDLEEVMAWKNGKFQFGVNSDLHVIMKKIARWYDVDVEYESGRITQRFGGELPMDSNLSQVLEILRTSGVKFTIAGKKVIVKP
jgi:ferric-dicitrate binding protein FerR (iron transport regulator)